MMSLRLPLFLVLLILTTNSIHAERKALSPDFVRKYWLKDSAQIIEELDHYQALWIKVHGCVWSECAVDNNDDDGEGRDGDENWYQYRTQDFCANTAFSLYGIPKRHVSAIHHCARGNYINSFFTYGGADVLLESLGKTPGVFYKDYQASSNANNNNYNNNNNNNNNNGNDNYVQQYKPTNANCVVLEGDDDGRRALMGMDEEHELENEQGEPQPTQSLLRWNPEEEDHDYDVLEDVVFHQDDPQEEVQEVQEVQEDPFDEDSLKVAMISQHRHLDSADDDDYSNYESEFLEGLSATMGCTSKGKFAMATFQGQTCDGNYFLETIDSMKSYNRQYNHMSCRRVWGRSFGNPELITNLLLNSWPCDMDLYPNSCPDPYGIKQRSANALRAAAHGQNPKLAVWNGRFKRPLRIISWLMFLVGTFLVVGGYSIKNKGRIQAKGGGIKGFSRTIISDYRHNRRKQRQAREAAQKAAAEAEAAKGGGRKSKSSRKKKKKRKKKRKDADTRKSSSRRRQQQQLFDEEDDEDEEPPVISMNPRPTTEDELGVMA